MLLYSTDHVPGTYYSIYYSIVPTMYLVLDACVRSVLYSNINLYIRGKHKVDWNFHIKQNFTTKLHGVQSTTVVPGTVLNEKSERILYRSRAVYT